MRGAVVRAIARLCVIVVILELLQVTGDKRHARVLDAVWGVLAGSVGVTVGVVTTRLRFAIQAWYRRRVSLVTGSLLLIGNIAIGGVVVASHTGTDLIGWDSQYPLFVGNERNAERPWLGGLRGITVYAQALTHDEVAAAGCDGS